MPTISTDRLLVFFGVLSVLAVGFVAVARTTAVPMSTLLPAYMFTPMVAGAAVVAYSDRSARTFGLRVGDPWWVAAGVGAGLALVVGTFAVSLLVPGVSLSPSPVDGVVSLPTPLNVVAVLAFTLVVGVTSNAVMAFGEEFGWRGYLLWELAPLGFWKASVAVGAVWGLWHAPSVLAGQQYPSFPYVGVVAMTAACVALSPVYTYLVWRADSVFAAVFLHGIFNGSAMTATAALGADGAVLAELVATPIGAAGVAVCAVAAAGIAATGVPSFDRERDGAQDAARGRHGEVRQ